jgi:putative flippase GtrA
MSDDTAIVFPEERVASPPLRAHTRVRHAMTQPHNWVQLGKFCAVGGTGYALNLGVFALLAVQFHMHHLVAATLAFLVAVMNNFWLNRHWTFSARDGHAGFQAARFLTVSALAFLFSLGMLELLVSGLGVAKVAAQAVSIAAATPLNFLGNKMWSFGRRGR